MRLNKKSPALSDQSGAKARIEPHSNGVIMSKNTQAVNVKWYPRLFAEDMVLAFLDGSKTATRWPLRKQPVEDVSRRAGQWVWEDVAGNVFRSPVCPGDVIWGRETWVELLAVSPASDEPISVGPGEQLIEPPTFCIDKKGNKRWNYDGTIIAYRANSDVEFCDGDGFSGDMADKDDMPHWRPSIHMPKEYTRLFGRVTGVKLVRVQDISEAEAKTEGVAPEFEMDVADFIKGMRCAPSTYILGFKHVWQRLYDGGQYAWEANPYVWAASFRRISKAEAEV